MERYLGQATLLHVGWGRVRIASQLALLSIFISASTARNILNRPKPRKPGGFPAASAKTEEKIEARSIPAWYPNHLWTIGCDRDHKFTRAVPFMNFPKSLYGAFYDSMVVRWTLDKRTGCEKAIDSTERSRSPAVELLSWLDIS